MSGGWTFMPKPERDDGDINTGLKQVHGGRMAKGMWGYFSFLKGWESFCSLFYSQTKSAFNT